MIAITCSKKDGLWRAGVRHPFGLAKYGDGFFNDDQMERLCAEPLLTVETGAGVPDNPFLDKTPPVVDGKADIDSLVKLDRLVTAIGTLPVDDKSLWTSSGAPQVTALAMAADENVSAAERDNAWKAWQQRNQ